MGLVKDWRNSYGGDMKHSKKASYKGLSDVGAGCFSSMARGQESEEAPTQYVASRFRFFMLGGGRIRAAGGGDIRVTFIC
jgi:hypothetical protein